MAHNFGSLVLTPVVQALQERYGSRRPYARLEGSGFHGTASVQRNPRSLPNATPSTCRVSGRPGGPMFSTEVVRKVF